MQLGMIGLGRMGASMASRLMDAGHRCVVYDVNPAAVASLAEQGATAASNPADLVQRLTPPRAVWLMLPHGRVTEEMIVTLSQHLQAGDTLIDGGNTFFHDDVRRAAILAERGVEYLDVGTSGGIRGRERGYCLMVGGARAAFERLDPIFAALSPGRGEVPPNAARSGPGTRAEQGYTFCGPAGAGHFVKMVHNGIEYGMMQALAEGFDILRGASGAQIPEERRYILDLADIAELWRRGSVVSSWLLDLTAEALAEDSTLGAFSGPVSDSGEGRWTVQSAVEEGIPAHVLTAALFARFRSQQQDHGFADRLLSAMRFKFGGHTAPRAD